MHFLHPDTEFKIANKCCSVLKKQPFEKFAKENDMYGTYTGVRQAEGGLRSMVYTSCVDIKQKNGHEFYTSMPIIDWSDELLERFIKKYNIKISDAYTVYGCTRTGCCGCPFSMNLKNELKILYDHEPNKYKAMMFFMKDVYMYQLVECEWDEEYMKEFNEKLPIIKQRNKEMMEKFRPKK
jgi:3'-phosphoadenosine 5'-phosphosulfate sulfotransferase (PAPS reductase)/FAD synthetase